LSQKPSESIQQHKPVPKPAGPDLSLTPDVRTPPVPAEPVSREEADRLDAEILLRQPFQVVDVHREAGSRAGPKRFVLVTHGPLSSERITVRTPTGSEVMQRTMFSPDLVVEVRDGRLRGVRAGLHEGP
jgi:hypothetical protein